MSLFFTHKTFRSEETFSAGLAIRKGNAPNNTPLTHLVVERKRGAVVDEIGCLSFFVKASVSVNRVHNKKKHGHKWQSTTHEARLRDGVQLQLSGEFLTMSHDERRLDNPDPAVIPTLLVRRDTEASVSVALSVPLSLQHSDCHFHCKLVYKQNDKDVAGVLVSNKQQSALMYVVHCCALSHCV